MNEPQPPRPQSGQILVIFALSVIGLCAMVGLGVDGAHLFATGRDVQGAADLAALAGAQLMYPSGTGTPAATAVAGAKTVVAQNGFPAASGAVVTVNSPPVGTPTPVTTQIEVVIQYPMQALFLPVVGVRSLPVTGRAVADYQSAKGYAIYSQNSTCSTNPYGIDFSAPAGTVINGGVHTNTDVRISTGLTINGTLDDLASCAGNNNLSGGPTISGGIANKSTPTPWPEVWSFDTAGRQLTNAGGNNYPCTYTIQGTFNVSVASSGTTNVPVAGTTPYPGLINGHLPPGVYCAVNPSGVNCWGSNDAEITWGTQDLPDAATAAGAVAATGSAQGATFVSQCEITSSSRFNFQTPYVQATPGYTAMLMYAGAQDSGGNHAIHFSSPGQWNGLWYAPNGTCDATGTGSQTAQGRIYCNNVKVTAAFTLTAPRDAGGSFSSALID